MPANGIIPAYAGSTSTKAPPTALRRDHPRIRGEHDVDSLDDVDFWGSSPHTRGAPSRAFTRKGCGRIIPAYAGSTRSG